MLVKTTTTTTATSNDNNQSDRSTEKRRSPESSFVLMTDQQHHRSKGIGQRTRRRPPPPPYHPQPLSPPPVGLAGFGVTNGTGNTDGLEMMMFCGECSPSTAGGGSGANSNSDTAADPAASKVIISPPDASTNKGDEEKKGDEEILDGEEGTFINNNSIARPASAAAAPYQMNTNFFLNTSSNDGSCCVIIDDDSSTSDQQQVQEDGEGARQPQQPTDNNDDNNNTALLVRSTLSVSGMCCTSEVPAVRRSLKQSGAQQVQINLVKKCVYVKHNPMRSTSAQKLAFNLSQSGFPSSVLIDGGCSVNTERKENKSIVPNFRPSKYVESTLKVSNLTKRHLVVVAGGGGGGRNKNSQQQQSLIHQQLNEFLSNNSLRAVHPHLNSRTVKIEHDPLQISAQQVCDKLNGCHGDYYQSDGLEAHILLDGAIEKLYLPDETNGAGGGAEEGEDGTGTSSSSTTQHQQQHHQDTTGNENEWKSSQLKWHVILSGIFWFISLLSAVQEWTHLVLYAGLLSVLFGLPTVAMKAWRTLKQKRFDSNCMMLLAAVGAVILGEYDEAASVSFLFSISEYLESRATERARKALSDICHLRPSYATLLVNDDNENNDNTEENNNNGTQQQQQRRVLVPASTLQIGSLISVRTGDKIAADGIVVEGTSSVDESSLTGESRPVHKTVGCTVSGGSMNVGNAQMIIRTTSTVDDSALSRLIRLVEEAQTNTSPTEKMIDGFARVYTPVVIVMATIMATVPWIFGYETGKHWTLNALIIVVIACPCALTISTPVTYAAGLAATAQRGVIVKGGMHLEALGNVTTVVFDKTGTLTEGNFQVEHLVEVTSGGGGASSSSSATVGEPDTSSRRKRMLELLAVMEAPSSHPLSATLVKAAEKEGVYVPKNIEVRDHKIIKGEGVEATVNGKQTYVGNRRLFERVGMYEYLSQDVKKMAEEWASNGGTVGFVGVDNHGEGIIGAYCMIDSVRPEAKDVCENLLFGGYNVVVLTGDGEGAALAVANQVGLPYDTVHSQLLPEDKLHYVGSLKRPAPKGSFSLFRRQPKVLFCGDGVNDAPALAVSDCGVSLGEGAAVAMEMSDVTLLDSNLKKLVYVIKMGTRVVYTVRENILLSLLCKLIVVALTFAGYMTLMYAILSDVGVMLLVTLNGMKLLPRSADDDTVADDDAPLLQLKRRHGRKRYDVVPSVTSTAPIGNGSSTIAEIV